MILFISDLHLSSNRPETTAAFRRFLAGPCLSASELWILGDLFDFWVGDDDLDDPFHASIAEDLATLSRLGIKVNIIPGNRDFLLGSVFATRSGARIAPEPSVLETHGKRILLLHGDAQCTSDIAYQRYRRRIRSPWSRAILRLMPLNMRRSLAQRIRSRSEALHTGQDQFSYDLDQEAITQLYRHHSTMLMIHGHTHQPAVHELEVDGRKCIRWVLADWHDQATWLELSPTGVFPRTELRA